MRIIFDDENINKSNYYRNKRLFKMYDSNVSKVLTPRKENSFQGYVGNDDHDNFGPLCKKPPLTIGYFKHFDSNKKVSFKVIDNGLLK